MQRLEVSCAVRHIYIYMLLRAEGLIGIIFGNFVNILGFYFEMFLNGSYEYLQ